MAIYEEMTISGVSVLHAAPTGETQARPILFVHGGWVGGWIWRNYLDFFSTRGYDCHALTLSGHASPTPTVGGVSMKEFAEEVHAVASALGDPILFGHSMGGLLVQKVAEMADPAAMVCLATAAPRGILGITSAKQLESAGRYLPHMLIGRPFIPELPDYAALALNRVPRDQHEEFHSALVPESGRAFLEMAVLGVPVDAARVRCPVLCLVGGDDQFTPPKVARQVAHRYGADLKVYPGMGHMLNLEPAWQTVAADIAVWLESPKVPASGPRPPLL